MRFQPIIPIFLDLSSQRAQTFFRRRLKLGSEIQYVVVECRRHRYVDGRSRPFTAVSRKVDKRLLFSGEVQRA